MAFDFNGEQMGFGRTLWDGLVGGLAFVGRCVMFPFRVLGFGAIWRQVAAEAGRIRLTDEQHRHRVRYKTVEHTPSTKMTSELEAEVKRYVSVQDWATLCVRIEALAVTRAVCPANRRLVHVALKAAIDAMAGPDFRKDVCAPMQDARIKDEVVADVIEASLGSLGGCVLAARVLLSQCWDLRGQDETEAVSADSAARIAAKTKEAMFFLGAAEDEPSGIIPLTQMLFLPFLGQMDSAFLDQFEQAIQADPGDTIVANAVGSFMRPQWGVDYDTLETLARQAALWTSDEIGMAAYAVFYNAALHADDAPVFAMDVDLYCEGIRDLVKLRGYSPDHIPGVSQRLRSLSQIPAHAQMTEEARQGWADSTAKFYELGLQLLEDHLGVIHPTSWQSGEEGALEMISLVMVQELEDGMNLVVGPKGISAHMPQAQAA